MISRGVPIGSEMIQPDPGDAEHMRAAFDANRIWTRKRWYMRLSWPLLAGLLAAAAVLVLALWASRPADAQERPPWAGPPCAPYADVVARLAAEYHEEMQFMGVTNAGELMELYSSGEGGTWTLLNVKPGGVACLIVAGKGFESKPVGEVTAFSKLSLGGVK